MTTQFESRNGYNAGMPAIPQATRQMGITSLEFTLVVGILIVLVGIFVDRAMRLNATVEQSRVESTLHNINTALAVMSVQKRFSDSMDTLQHWEVRPEADHANQESDHATSALSPEINYPNPMAHLMRAAGNYRGEWPDPTWDVAPGEWYFDPQQGFLVYRLRYTSQVNGGADNPPRLRFRIIRDPNTAGLLQLQAVESFEWVKTNGP